MPYIKQTERAMLINQQRHPKNAGELNFAITQLVNQFLLEDDLRYNHINEVIGALECVKQELYRRVAGPYEDCAKLKNGDVYPEILTRTPQ